MIFEKDNIFNSIIDLRYEYKMIKKRLRKSLNLSFYKLPAKWTIFELWQTIDTRNQMSTR